MNNRTRETMISRLKKYCKVIRMPKDVTAKTINQIIAEGEESLTFEYYRLFGGPNEGGRDSLTHRNPETADCTPEWRRSFGYERSMRIANFWRGIKAISDSNRFKILDVGCGDGWSLEAYDRVGIKNAGVDKSLLAAELSRHGTLEEEKMRTADGEEIMTYRIVYNKKMWREVVRCDILDLDKYGFEENEFNAVNYTGAMMMLPWVEDVFKTEHASKDNIDKCLESLLQIKQVHAPNGYLHLITSTKKFAEDEPEYANLTEKEMRDLVGRANYKIVDFEILHGGDFFRYVLKNKK